MAQIIKIEDYISRYELDMNRYSNQFIRYKKLQWESVKNHENTELHEKKNRFLNHVFHHQLIWASSTIRSHSYMNQKYNEDVMLKHFALSLPDQYFIMYYPVFCIKKAPIEADIIIICPTEILCVSLLDGEKDEVVLAKEGRFWIRRGKDGEKKIINPMTSLSRTEGIIKGVIKEFDSDLFVKKILINKNGYIHAPELPVHDRVVDKRDYQDWLVKLQQNPSPIKHHQLKIAKALLKMCLTNAYNRFEFDI
ncbi:NERD domain-containing protein [Bacillus sp. FJAT-47783]|uniref:NERD domain-containing protein n=1 Tax=Bacillus sp. FJAT-47783 TaxID=2922712 RepID=UPI001FAB70CD|nr:NERD domain-containing protein [Bacillus sp. FJAT-47783]